jgi:hypothetical protein
MANIYKIKGVVSGKYSKKNYTRAGAKAAQKAYDDKGIETIPVVYRQNCEILDTTADSTGIVEFFRQGYAKPKKAKKEEEN